MQSLEPPVGPATSTGHGGRYMCPCLAATEFVGRCAAGAVSASKSTTWNPSPSILPTLAVANVAHSLTVKCPSRVALTAQLIDFENHFFQTHTYISVYMFK